jgi:hypothetical protein
MVWNGWSRGPSRFDTYYCSSYTEFHQSTCSLYQRGAGDWITVEAYKNYDIFNADGDKVRETPNGTPLQKVYDVVIVSEELNPEILTASIAKGKARGPARERYFFGRIGGDYYGLVRWDAALEQNGSYQLTDRTISYGWDTSYNPQFTGMQARGAQDQ